MRSFAALSLALLAQGLGVVAAPVSEATNVDNVFARQCLVNARYEKDWVEAGLSRYRTLFSAEGTDPGYWYELWQHNARFWGGINPACWEEKGVSWMADASWSRGPAGTKDYDGCRDATLRDFMNVKGCTTG